MYSGFDDSEVLVMSFDATGCNLTDIDHDGCSLQPATVRVLVNIASLQILSSARNLHKQILNLMEIISSKNPEANRFS